MIDREDSQVSEPREHDDKRLSGIVDRRLDSITIWVEGKLVPILTSEIAKLRTEVMRWREEDSEMWRAQKIPARVSALESFCRSIQLQTVLITLLTIGACGLVSAVVYAWQ